MLSVEKEIGERLRQARESMGLSLDQLQEKTKIQKSFIKAIESGEFSKLPSPFYVRTYLRAYCKCVKIEPHHILRQYRKAEQAERGLTSVHQAITPELQAQLQQQGIQTNAHMIHNNGTIIGSGLQKTLSQAVRKNSTNRNARTNMSTALTIAKKSNLPSHQQIHQVEASKLHNETILTQHKKAKQTTKAHYDYTKNSTSNTRLSPAIEHTQNTLQNKGIDRTRKTLKKSTYRDEKQSQTLHSTAERPEQKTKNRSYHDNSRFATNQPKDKSSKTNNPSVLERRKLKTDLSKQEVTKIPKLSRSSVRRSRRSARSGSFDWANKKTLIILASLVICIPLLWATVNALATDDADENNDNKPMMKTDQTKTKNQTPVTNSTQNEKATEDQIVLTQSSPQLNTYEVSGTDRLNLQFRAQGESWIQVRKQPDPQKEGFLDEATLQSGHEDSYSHNFSDGKEIWISLGIPEYVVVTLNGKPIKSSKTIHIKQK